MFASALSWQESISVNLNGLNIVITAIKLYFAIEKITSSFRTESLVYQTITARADAIKHFMPLPKRVHFDLVYLASCVFNTDGIICKMHDSLNFGIHL